MRSDIEAAILGMYDSIERAREAQAAAGHSDQGARQGITSGKHLDPIAAIIRDDLINAGFHPDESMTKDACAHYRLVPSHQELGLAGARQRRTRERYRIEEHQQFLREQRQQPRGGINWLGI